jgi:hypothetical protein
LLAGEIKLPGNLFWANGANTTLDAGPTGIIRITSGQPTQDDPDASDLIAHLIANNSAIANPGIQSISRDQDYSLDPRPTAGSAAYTNPRAAYPQDDFFTSVNYIGAFSADESAFWLNKWSTLFLNGHLDETISSIREVVDPTLTADIIVYPNPAQVGTGITIEADLNSNYRVEVYNMQGMLIRVFDDLSSGTETLDLQNVSNGMYLLKCVTEDLRVAAKILILE